MVELRAAKRRHRLQEHHGAFKRQTGYVNLSDFVVIPQSCDRSLSTAKTTRQRYLSMLNPDGNTGWIVQRGEPCRLDVAPENGKLFGLLQGIVSGNRARRSAQNGTGLPKELFGYRVGLRPP